MRTAAVKFIFILLCCCMAVSLCASAAQAEETAIEGEIAGNDSASAAQAEETGTVEG